MDAKIEATKPAANSIQNDTDKQTLLAVLQFLKKQNLKVSINNSI